MYCFAHRIFKCVQCTSSFHITCLSVFLFDDIDAIVCFVCVVMFHAHLFFGYVWCVVHMHRAGQAASQSCVALAVGSIPHRVAYRSGLVPNSDRLQYSCTWSGLQEWPWCTVGSQPNPRLCLESLIWQLVVFRIMHSFFHASLCAPCLFTDVCL
jgi:hypothetical protein